jgi:hypothetical protein
MAFVSRTALRMGPTWRTSFFAHYRDIFEPYATNLNYYNNAQERARVPLWDIANGCILWLPTRSEIRNEALLDPTSKISSPEFFGRPVLVLEVDIQGPTNGIVYFAKMSSFSESGGVQNWLHRKPADAFNVILNQPLADGILPIAWGPSSPLKHNQNHGLHLEDEENRGRNTRMPEGAYVCIKDGLYSVDANDLRCYNVMNDPLSEGRKDGKWSDGVRMVVFFGFNPFFGTSSHDLTYSSLVSFFGSESFPDQGNANFPII